MRDVATCKWIRMKKRKIEIVGRTLSFAEAEAEDDLFWSGTTELFRLL